MRAVTALAIAVLLTGCGGHASFTVPKGTALHGKWRLGKDTVAITYAGPREEGGGPYDRAGFAVWEHGHRAYVIPTPGVEAFGVHVGDVTGDGRLDVLLFLDTDGSGACGSWRVAAEVGGTWRKLFATGGCRDDYRVTLERRAVVVYHGVHKTRASGSYIHCCWNRWRRTELRWRGGTLVTRRVTFVRKPPVGAYRD